MKFHGAPFVVRLQYQEIGMKVSPSLACQYILRGYLKSPERADEHISDMTIG